MNWSRIKKTLLSSGIYPLLDWIYPHNCFLCNSPELNSDRLVCKTCWQTIPLSNDHSIHSLWLVRQQNETVYFDGFYSIFLLNTSMQRIIHSFKYDRMKKFAQEIIHVALSHIRNQNNIVLCDSIIPIPLHTKKLRSRGYNQSFLLAKQVGLNLSIPVLQNGLIREKNTPSQTALNAVLRQKNMVDAFSLNQHHCVKNSAVLLVDDIITTGVTANECAKVLKKSGAAYIFLLTIARTI